MEKRTDSLANRVLSSMHVVLGFNCSTVINQAWWRMCAVPSTCEARGSKVQGYFWVHSKFKAQSRLCLCKEFEASLRCVVTNLGCELHLEPTRTQATDHAGEGVFFFFFIGKTLNLGHMFWWQPIKGHGRMSEAWEVYSIWQLIIWVSTHQTLIEIQDH